jgi:hypothetical protein
MVGVERIQEKIKSFKKKYYLNIFVRGALLSATILASYFVLAALLEYSLWLAPWARFVIVLCFGAVMAFCLYRFLREPLRWYLARRGLNEEQSAKLIGNYVPNVNDRLLNLVQLTALKHPSSLSVASVEQKSREFESVSFDRFINLQENKKYLKFLIIPIAVVAAILVLNSSILTQSTSRLVHFNRQYSPAAPFSFRVSQENLVAYFNEQYTLEIDVDGKTLPESAYLLIGKQRLKLDQPANGHFSYSFDNIQEGFDFQIEAAGFFSDQYAVSMVSRPDLEGFNVDLRFPPYLQRKAESLVNAGNLEVPEGTEIAWNVAATNAERASIQFASEDNPINLQSGDNHQFKFSRGFVEPDQYEIILQNEHSRNKEKIAYRIDVVKDEYPKIQVNNFKDSILFKMVVLSGMVSDDYGVNRLSLHYKVQDEQQNELHSRTIPIDVTRGQPRQSFFHPWRLDSMKLRPGDVLSYYLEVWDNDGVNGSKSSKTGRYTFLVPSADNLVADIDRSQNDARQKIDQGVGKANKLQEQIEQAGQKLKGKQSLDWQDKKMLEDILQQKSGLDKLIEELKEQNQLLEQKKDAFTEQDQRIREKAEQIQKLMEELLDEETKKLFEELQKLLREKSDVSQIQKILDKLNQNTNNLEKELERTLELFKQLQYEYKLDQTAQDLKEQIEKQKALLEQTEQVEKDRDDPKGEKKDGDKAKADEKSKDKKSSETKGDKAQDEQNKDSAEEKDGANDEESDGNESKEQAGEKNDSEQLAEKQEKLQEELDKLAEDMKDLREIGEELDKQDDLPSDSEMDNVQEQQQQSKEMLQQNSPSKSKPPQKNAIQQMQQMQQQLEGAQSAMSMEIDMQNLETLRHIIHGLVKLSFDEENLMTRFNNLSQNDPAFNGIAQEQLKLRDDAKVLEDSLLALGKRDPFMGSIVTREVGELNEHIDKVIDANRERRRPQASSEMQMTMTSINNLALMLDDHFDMMMQMMANAQPGKGKKGKDKKGNKPSLSQLQQQLNNRIRELKESGKSGRELSEELAQMAAEQERIRKALEEMQGQMKDGGKPGEEISGKMEETEMDLVNKQLTEELIKRQQEIVTRLLQAEKAEREQDMDDERKGETAKDYEKEIPRAFEEYLRLKEKEVELLKTVPPKLYPYYKKEVNEYFKRVGED